jgi:hypothetical protein
MAIFDDLGSMIGGAPEAIAPTWKSLVDSPEKQAALMSFGLQLMAGGHGDQFQRLAVAGGHGMEAASATEAANRQHQEKERAFAAGQQEKSADRASREKVAQIGADSRMDVAQTRVAGMLERAAMIRQPKNDAEIKFFNDQLGKVSKDLERDIIGGLKIGGAERDQLIRARALERLHEAREQGLFAGGASKGGASNLGGPGTDGAPSNFSSGKSPLGAARGMDPSTMPAATPAPDAKATGNGSDLMSLLRGPQGEALRERILTPEGRQWLLQRRPDLQRQLEEYEKLTQTYGGTPR